MSFHPFSIYQAEREVTMLQATTNIKAIDRSQLKQRGSVKIDTTAPREKRIADLKRQINPYCYLDGDVVVISRFSDTDVSIEDCCRAYLAGL